MSNNIETVLNQAKKMSADRMLKLPTYGAYIHADEQIKFIEHVLSRGDRPTDQEISNIDIDLMAVKELDSFDMEYSDLLCELSFLFKRL